MKFKVIFTLILICSYLFVSSQTQNVKRHTPDHEYIQISNGSFEQKKLGPYRDSYTLKWLKDWYDVNDSISSESPPTWHSVRKKMFNVKMKASEGKRFIGLVVRENGSVESLAQRFESKFNKDFSYTLSVQINHSDQMVHRDGDIGPLGPFALQAGLTVSIWDSSTKKLYVIDKFNEYTSGKWTKKTINFVAPCECDTIIFSSHYIEEIKQRKGLYFGNVLIDNISNITSLK